MSKTTLLTDAPFIPRKEFMREAPRTTNAFYLLAVSGSSAIRLYSFPPPLIASLRRMFEQRKLLVAFREDVALNLCEYTLEGKPWASGKSVFTENLLVDILAVIYQFGYTFLSTIDYGRENDDRLAIAFSKPTELTPTNTDSPKIPASHTGSGFSNSSASQATVAKRVPFALSFPGATVLRVLTPPLHSTPAILAAVRGAWPRGVVSEKKIGDNAYEFKLKGYKWFQEDTFATDSLRYILTLLSSLDGHNFTLLTSLSLTNRSRVKDLWIFTGPAPLDSDPSRFADSPPSSLNNSSSDIRRGTENTLALTHHRQASAPAQSPAYSANPSPHRRAATDNNASMAKGQLRNPALGARPYYVPPPPQPAPEDYDSFYRADLPSIISSNNENMTGVGAGGRYDREESELADEEDRGESSAGPDTPPRTPRAPPPSALVAAGENSTFHHQKPRASPTTPSPPSSAGLLSPGVFRDTTFSSDTDRSTEIPVKWTGLGPRAEESEEGPRELSPSISRKQAARLSSQGPILPGGWQSTPVDEISEATAVDSISTSETQDQQNSPAMHDVNAAKVVSPTHFSSRKSEVGVIGTISEYNSTPPPLVPTPLIEKGKGKEGPLVPGQGWVLVNVNSSTLAKEKGDPIGLAVLSSPDTKPQDFADLAQQTDAPQPIMAHSVMHPAKAIAVADALDASKDKKKASGSGIKRLFGLTKKNSEEEGSDEASSPSAPVQVEEPLPVSASPKGKGKLKSTRKP